MDRLAPLLCEGPSKNADKRWEYRLTDPRTKQTLVVEHDGRDFSVYNLDQDWAGRTKKGAIGDVKEPSVDGLVIAAFDDVTLVCFVDLKGKMATPDQVAHAVKQFESSASHFAPCHRAGESDSVTHGDDHHASWSDSPGTGVEEKLAGHPSPDHQVSGVVIFNREVARFRPPPLQVAGKAVHLRAVRADRREAPNVGRIAARQLRHLSPQ